MALKHSELWLFSEDIVIASQHAQPRVLVLGASGFLGRYATAALLDRGVTVIVGTRRPGRPSGHLPAAAHACEQRGVRFESLLESAAWRELIADADAVVNCVGILRQRGAATYDRVHHLAPAALAVACADAGKRLVHVSALGLHADAGSRFLTSKLRGEGAIRAAGGDALLVRPSLLDGPDGFGARWLRGVAKLPLFFAPTGATGRIAALAIRDLGAALATLATASAERIGSATSRDYELGGDVELAFADYIHALGKRYRRSPAIALPVPALASRAFAHFCDLIHWTPFSYGHWELLRRDNQPRPNRLRELLGRAPRVVI